MGLTVEYVDLTPTGMQNDLRTKPPGGCVIHTPGRTFVNKVRQRTQPIDDLELDEACARAFDAMKYQGGVFIGQSGKAWLLQHHDRRTWHSAMLASNHPQGNVYAQGFDSWASWALPLGDRRWQKHGRDPSTVYDFWRAVFDPIGIRSPCELPFRRSPNSYVGIDLRPDTQGNFSAAQLCTLRAVVAEIAEFGGFEIDATTVLTHSLADPLSRGTIKRKGKIWGVAWDPGKRWNHTAFLESFNG